ncbi:hypothetical protein GCM10010885_18440 [Alicyclobacillus cellulosilyticus]|uniref:Uncharacterized protein n=1 Tax=Alicyclobacillus cellulosilyticus TaxID=1003997 RepID=A0A917NMT2_9BACL|nr:hypothetical protein [Alicyclobacillus cellulosilyticus]GGJ09644.1 hypothetical protein GCM10010885_18440 [Alicyclobacillus cellulosilyticus]
MTFADLTFREKVEYIWMYYKYHILIGLMILIGVVYTVVTVTARVPAALNVLVISGSVPATASDPLSRAATAALIPPGRRAAVEVQCLPVAGRLTDPENYAAVMKLMAMVAAHDVDVVVTDRQDFAQLAKQGMFVDLNARDQASAWLRQHPDDAVHVPPLAGTTGIVMTPRSRFARLAGVRTEEVAGVVQNGPHGELAIRFALWAAETAE